MHNLRGPRPSTIRRPPTGYRVSRRGNFVPLGPLPPRPIRRLTRRNPPIRRAVNPRIPNTFRARKSGTRRQYDNLVVTKQEYWFSVEKGVNKYTFVPGSSGIPHLDRFGQIHESAQVRHFKIMYRPSAGTTVPGNLTLGVDYQPENERKPSDIKMLDTNVSGTIFTQASLRLIVNRMQKNVSWLGTASAANPHQFFALYVDADTDADKIGQIWVSYKVAFSDPTSPSGPALLNKQNIASITSTLTSDITIDQPNVLQITHEANDFISVNEPTHPVEIDDEGTNYQTKLDIDQTMPVGSDFTIGSSHSVPNTLATHAYRASPPKITFKYSDGTSIPDGTIVPLQSFSPPTFRAQGMQSDIFASIFKLLKPLAKPVWGFLDQLVQPLISYSVSPGKFSTDPAEYPADQLTTFAFTGDNATITVPVTDRDSVTSRFPVTIMQSLGHGYATAVKNYVSVYSHNLLSHPTSWLTKVDDGGGTGYATILKTVFQHPDGVSKAFQNGDLITIFINTVPIERGIGNDVHTPFAAPIDDTTVKSLISQLETSSLSNSDDIDPDAPKLKILDYTNQSNSTTPSKTVGVWMTGRFVSTFSDTAYLKAVIPFPIGAIIGGVDVSSSLSAVLDPGVNYFHKPDTDYNMALGFITFQFFPTAAQALKVFSTPSQFTITRVNDDAQARLQIQSERTKRSYLPSVMTDSENEDSDSESK